ncbi:hypothetical protein LMTR3_09575 [Bradyrhizobium sp. LMTR 3]|nr:hypothetical protein LMTR3_09575 [Bradyrhizobium sp. LMTR 3]
MIVPVWKQSFPAFVFRLLPAFGVLRYPIILLSDPEKVHPRIAIIAAAHLGAGLCGALAPELRITNRVHVTLLHTVLQVAELLRERLDIGSDHERFSSSRKLLARGRASQRALQIGLKYRQRLLKGAKKLYCTKIGYAFGHAFYFAAPRCRVALFT